jgi:hypothetical protein
MSPSSSTGMSAMARTQIAPAWVMRLAMFSAVRKVSLSEPKTMKRTTSPSVAGRAPMSPPRRRLR